MAAAVQPRTRSLEVATDPSRSDTTVWRNLRPSGACTNPAVRRQYRVVKLRLPKEAPTGLTPMDTCQKIVPLCDSADGVAITLAEFIQKEKQYANFLFPSALVHAIRLQD